MTIHKKKPIPFSADSKFVTFLDDLMDASGYNRSHLLRIAAKEYSKKLYPKVFEKHFPNEAKFLSAQASQDIAPTAIIAAGVPEVEDVHKEPTVQVRTPLFTHSIAPIMKPPMLGNSDADKDKDTGFLDSIEVPVPKGNDEPEYGTPSHCPACGVPRFDIGRDGTAEKPNLFCSTNPSTGKWACSECSASGRYYPDKPPSID